MENEFLLLEEVARAYRTSTSTVRQWIRKGRLRSVRLGRRRLIRREELLRFQEAHTSGSPDGRLSSNGKLADSARPGVEQTAGDTEPQANAGGSLQGSNDESG